MISPLLLQGVSVVTHVFGFVSGVALGAMLLRDEVEEVRKKLSPTNCQLSPTQPREKIIKIILWTLFWFGFGVAFGINLVGWLSSNYDY